MKDMFLPFIAATVLAAAAHAATYSVTDYSWLQLPDGITPSAGSPDHPIVTSGWTAHGSIDYIRGAMWVWIPSRDLTARGASDFWGALHFDPPRNVKAVNVQLWGQQGSTWRRFTVEGSVDGETYSEIGAYDAGDWQSIHWWGLNGLAVTNGTYAAIRIRFAGSDSKPDDPDYFWGKDANGNDPGYGGPGITLLEPIGDGVLSAEEVNFVNGPTFDTATVNNVDWNAGQRFNTGTLNDSQMVGERIDATGNGWDAGHYLQVDLGQERRIYRSTVAVCQGYWMSAMSFAWSNDGTTWTDIANPVGPSITYANCLVSYTFPPVSARYWRITGMGGGHSEYALISQWMLYGTERESLRLDAHDSTFAIDAQNLGRFAIDDFVSNTNGSWTYTATPTSFRYIDAGSTIPVAITVSDGTLQMGTNVNVAVVLDPSLDGRITVTDYNWLETPPGFVTPFAGTSANPYFTSGGCSVGNMDWLRWGADWAILHENTVNHGAYDYWFGQEFASPRNVHTVRLRFWTDAARALRRFAVEGSADGSAYSTIATYDFGEFNTSSPYVTLPVTPGVYKSIRVRINGTDSQPGDPDYTSGSGHGAPGFAAIEPVGDGILAYDEINWAQRVNFDTVASTVNNPEWNGRNFNDGFMWDQNQTGTRTPWVEGTYLDIDLGVARPVYRTILANNLSYGPSSATFAYSTDGVAWHDLVTSAPTLHTGDTHGAVEYTFAPTTARYWRITSMSGPSWVALIDEWLLFATQRQAPVQFAHDATYVLDGSGHLLGPEDVDGGSYDPNDLPLTYSFSRQEFGFDDVGQTFPVTYTIANEFTSVITNVNVTVRLGANVGNKIPVSGYNWLQLPPGRVTGACGLISDDLSTTAPLRNGYGYTDSARWGHWVWIPMGPDLQNSNYWYEIRFDTPRNVSRVATQFWIHSDAGAALRAYHVDGQTANGDWGEIGFQDFGEMLRSSTGLFTIPVTNGTYQAVRVRIMSGEYEGNPSGGFGGPGIDCLNPIGGGLVEPDEINWANRWNFAATCSWHGVNNYRDNYTYLDGDFTLFREYANAWVGSNSRSFNPGDYIQVDLGRPRHIGGVTTLWSYFPASYRLQASLDGSTFTYIDLEEPWTYGDRTMHHDFVHPLRARYIRLVDADASRTGHALMDRILVIGATPPGTMLLVR